MPLYSENAINNMESQENKVNANSKFTKKRQFIFDRN